MIEETLAVQTTFIGLRKSTQNIFTRMMWNILCGIFAKVGKRSNTAFLRLSVWLPINCVVGITSVTAVVRKIISLEKREVFGLAQFLESVLGL